MASRPAYHKQDFTQVELDSFALALVTFRLVEKFSRKFKFTLGDQITDAVYEVGANIRRGLRARSAKGRYLASAIDALDRLAFGMEVAMVTGLLTLAEKTAFDAAYTSVFSQTRSLQSTLYHSEGRSPEGDASGAEPR